MSETESIAGNATLFNEFKGSVITKEIYLKQDKNNKMSMCRYGGAGVNGRKKIRCYSAKRQKKNVHCFSKNNRKKIHRFPKTAENNIKLFSTVFQKHQNFF